MNATPTTPKTASVWRPMTLIGLAAVVSIATTYVLRNNHQAPVDLRVAAQADLDRRGYHPLSAGLRELLDDANFQPAATQAHPLLGLAAPDFSLTSVDGTPWRLSEKLKNGPVLLVFYYGYHCDHCVSQLFGLNKDSENFRELNAEVVAVSADPVDLTRERYKQYGRFSFPVLSDVGNRVARDYSVFVPPSKPDESGDLLHGTFVIDIQGKVVWANRGDGPFTDNRTLLKQLHAATHHPRDGAAR